MTQKNFGLMALMLLLSGVVMAAGYTAPDTEYSGRSPTYHPSKEAPYDDSYHIAGVNMNNDRAIASEQTKDNIPSEYSAPEVSEPKPWSYKTEDKPNF